jgi:hypothetical protein
VEDDVRDGDSKGSVEGSYWAGCSGWTGSYSISEYSPSEMNLLLILNKLMFYGERVSILDVGRINEKWWSCLNNLRPDLNLSECIFVVLFN